MQLVLQPLDGYQVERSGSHAVALDTVLDDELRREGLAREVVHAVQNARKEAGLEVEDRIALALGGDDELLAAVRDHEAYVTGETLATSLDLDGAADAAALAHDRGPRATHRRRARLSRRPAGHQPDDRLLGREQEVAGDADHRQLGIGERPLDALAAQQLAGRDIEEPGQRDVGEQRRAGPAALQPRDEARAVRAPVGALDLLGEVD